MEDIAQKIEKDREEFRSIVDRVLNNPIDRFIDEIAIPVFVFATFKRPAPACIGLAATARIVAPRMGQVATTLGTVEISRELTTFFNKKSGGEIGKRHIPSAESKIEYHKQKVSSGEWKPCGGEWKGYYEGKIGGKVYRFKPTVEKHEYEVYKEFAGKGEHWGIFRTEGNRAFEVLEEYGKHTIKGKW